MQANSYDGKVYQHRKYGFRVSAKERICGHVATHYVCQPRARHAAHQYYKFVRELPAGKGFADIVLIPYRNVNMPAIVLELKYNKSAEGAIEQIKKKQYLDVLRGFTGDIILVGINYDKRTKQHECVIERLSNQGGTQAGTQIEDLNTWIEIQIRINPNITTESLSKMAGVSIRTIKRRIADMSNIRFVGSGYSGHWEIIPSDR